MLPRIALLLCLTLTPAPALAREEGGSPREDTTVASTMADTIPAEKSDTRTDSDKEHAKADYLGLLFVFVLATFIGLGVVARVSRLLHTPLMSLTNAISAIAVVGAIIVAGSEGYPLPIRLLGVVAIFASTTNLVSGFLITDRMLKMFKQTRPQEKQ